MVSPLTVVHVHDKRGKTHVFAPGDTLPKWAVTAIDNPKVLPAGTDTEPAGQATPASETATPPASENTPDDN